MNLLDVLPQASPRAANRIYGVVVGIVTNNQDPDGLGRVRLRFPWLSAHDESGWARIASLMAGADRGAYFLPEVDDEVLVAFEQGDVRFPYVLGALWNGNDKPPGNNVDGNNNQRLFKSRSGHLLRLDDTEGEARIEIIGSSGKCHITLDANANTITLDADRDVVIRAGNGKLSLSGNRVEITSQAELTIEAGQNMDLKAGPQLNLKGQIININ
jgi:uncharacterized protein involved in type VI secretion and phage assembly